MSETQVQKPAVEPDAADVKSLQGTTNYIVLGVIIVAILIALYYAYQNFTKNKKDCDDEDQERGDKKSKLDYSLSELINSIERKQRDIIKTLSENSTV
jgi:hypothetical protein